MKNLKKCGGHWAVGGWRLAAGQWSKVFAPNFSAPGIIALLIACCSLAGCTKKPPTKTKEQVIQEKLDERLVRWKSDLEQRCLDQAMDKAIAIVDSTIIANARLNRDTAGKPYVPLRPVKPDFVMPKDSTPVKPLLKQEQDTSRF